MPGPLLIAGSIVANKALGLVTGPALNVLERGINYAANAGTPNIMPSVNEIFDAHFKGLIPSRVDLATMLKWHGINIGTGGLLSNEYQQYWEPIYQANRPAFDVGFARQAYRMGKFAIVPGNLNDDELRFHLSRGGLASERLKNIYMSTGELLTFDEYMEAYLRGEIGLETFLQRAQALNFVEPVESQIQLALANDYPSIDTMADTSAKLLYDPAIAALYGLDRERPEWWPQWGTIARKGASVIPKTFPGFTGQYLAWHDIAWRNHWQWPSYQALIDQSRRIGGMSQEEINALSPGAVVPTDSDIDYALQREGVPPYYRANAKLMAYNIIGIRQINRLIQTNIIDEAKASDLLVRSGYSRVDADLEVKALFKLQRAKDLARVRTDTKGNVESAFSQGMIGKDDASILLYRLEITDPEELANFDAFPRQQQLNLANNDSKIQTQITALSAKFNLSYIKRWVALLHKAVIDGAIAVFDAGLQLQQLGLQQWIIDAYTRLWTGEVAFKHKDLSAGKIVKYVTIGILTAEQAAIRLANLGFTLDAINGMMAEAQITIASKLLKEQQQTAKTKAQQLKEAEKEKKAADKAARTAQLQMLRLGTVAQLKKWLACGKISEQEMTDRLQFEGYEQKDIDRVIADAKAGKCKQ